MHDTNFTTIELHDTTFTTIELHDTNFTTIELHDTILQRLNCMTQISQRLFCMTQNLIDKKKSLMNKKENLSDKKESLTDKKGSLTDKKRSLIVKSSSHRSTKIDIFGRDGAPYESSHSNDVIRVVYANYANSAIDHVKIRNFFMSSTSAQIHGIINNISVFFF